MKEKSLTMKKTLQITYTAVLTAMLVLLQSTTKAGGQFVTGSCVNMVLAIGALFTSAWTGVAAAVISPFFCFYARRWPPDHSHGSGNCAR